MYVSRGLNQHSYYLSFSLEKYLKEFSSSFEILLFRWWHIDPSSIQVLRERETPHYDLPFLFQFLINLWGVVWICIAIDLRLICNHCLDKFLYIEKYHFKWVQFVAIQWLCIEFQDQFSDL